MSARPLLPKEEPDLTQSGEAAVDSKSSKRRAVSSACIPCRKRKSKCDGGLPSCSTCTAVYLTVCSYDADSDHRRKGALKRDIQSLRQQNDALDVIVASLRSLPEHESIALLHNLRNEQNLDYLAAALRSNVSLPPSFASQTLEADFAQHLSVASLSGSSALDRESSSSFSPGERSVDDPQLISPSPTPGQRSASWFRSPQDAELTEHLLKLYFSWCDSFYNFLSRDHFLHDMGHGRTEHCSALLINALMSFASHYSDRPSVRSDPSNPATAGDPFFAEAKNILDSSEKSCLTTVQALAIMSVRECSQGRDSNGYQLAGRAARMALELGLHLSVMNNALSPSEVEVRKVTFWAVFNVETICAVGFGRLSQLPRAATDIGKPVINERLEVQTWRPYQDTNFDSSQAVEQLARPMTFINEYSRLSELANDMVNTFYAPQDSFTTRRLAETYANYQKWYQDLPDAFRLDNTSLPHVLVLHMYYYACILHLFRPYIKLDLHAANLYPRDTCTFCANEISALTNALRAMYGLRRVCLAVPSLLLSASTIHLLNLPAEQSAAHLNQSFSDLQAMSVNHRFAAKCVEIIRSLAAKWNISLPDSFIPVPVFGGPARRWPSPPISSFFAASTSRHPSSSGGTRSSDSETQQSPLAPPPPQQQQQQQQQHQQHQQQTTFFSDPSTLLDPSQNAMAFWTPFPAQGMPMQPLNFDAPLDYSHLSRKNEWFMDEQ